MSHAGASLGWFLGFVAVVLLGWFCLRPREARLERRRRKSHNRVVSKASRPMVKFSVRPPKEE